MVLDECGDYPAARAGWSSRHGLLAFERSEEPCTPAESARAHRLAELAEIVEIDRQGRRTAD